MTSILLSNSNHYFTMRSKRPEYGLTMSLIILFGCHQRTLRAKDAELSDVQPIPERSLHWGTVTFWGLWGEQVTQIKMHKQNPFLSHSWSSLVCP